MKGKEIIKKLAVVLGFIGLLVGLVNANLQQKKQKIVGFRVNINALNGDPFLGEQDVKQYVESKLDTFTGKENTQVNLNEIEYLVEQLPPVRNAEVFLGIGGLLQIDVALKTTIARIKPDSTTGYYLDTDGKIMPWVKSYSPRVFAVTGKHQQYLIKAYPQLLPKQRLELFHQHLYEFANMVSQDTFWVKQVVQVEINENGDAEIIPLIGNQRIIFGALNNSKEKFDKLLLFYQEVISKVGWNKYSEVNLKFDHQIVCK